MYLNQKLWKISYLLEFWQNETITDAFAFSVPVQSEDYNFPQRIAETKTFGGTVIDDYGNDIITINLSGTTINQDVKIIYKGSKGFDYLTGKEEIFYLQSLIEKYGQLNKLKNKKVMLYELNGGIKSGLSLKHYQIFITNFQIKRSKEKPFCYDYVLQAKAIFKQKEKKDSLFIEKLKEKIKDLKEKINENIKSLEEQKQKLFNAIDTYAQALDEVKQCVTTVVDYAERYESLLTDSIEKIADAITETQEIGDTIINTAFRLSPKYIATNIIASCNDLVSATDNLVSWWQSFSKGQKYKQIEASYNGSKMELKDNMTILVARTKNNSEKLAEALKNKVSTVDFVVVPNIQDSITKAYGFSQKKVSDSTTWEKLSYDTYGTADYATMLELFNNNNELKRGDIVYIPILDESKDTIEGNEIVREYGVLDNAGKDLLIKDGDFSIKNGDLDFSTGIETINQGIESRLSTMINSRVRNIVYGIRSNVGDSNDVSSSYILESIKQTILNDPRIDSIEQLFYEGDGESIRINLNYITKDGILNSYIGRI